MKWRQWDNNYLEKVNRRLSVERNTLVKMLTNIMNSGAVLATSSISDCLQYTGDLSVEFRQEMDAIIAQMSTQNKESVPFDGSSNR